MSENQTRDVTFTLSVREGDDARAALQQFGRLYQSMYETIDEAGRVSAEKRATNELSSWRGAMRIMQEEAERRLAETSKKFDSLIGRMSGAKPVGEESPFSLRKPAMDAAKGVADSAKLAAEHFKDANTHVGTLFQGVDRIGKSTASWLRDLSRVRDEFRALSDEQKKLGALPTMPVAGGAPRGKPRDTDEVRRERASQAGLNPLQVGHDQFMEMSDSQQKRILENQQRLRARIADEARKAREREAQDEQRFLSERARRWERTEDQIFRTRQSSNDRMRGLDHELGQSLLTVSGGLAHLGRSFALLGLAGEENSRKLVDGLMKAQAAFDLIKGGAQTFLAIKRAFDLFNLSQRESAKLKEADAKSAELAREKSLAMTAALTTEAAAAERAARSHEHLARSRSRSGGAGGGAAASGIVSGMFGGFGGRGRRGRIGRGAAIASALEMGGAMMADDSDSGGMSDALIAGGMGVDLLSMLRPGYLSRGLQSAGRGLSMAGRVAGPVAWGAAAVGAGANVLDVAQGRDPSQAGRNQWLGDTLLGGSLAVSRMTGWTGSGASIADIGGDGGERFTDTTRRILEFESNRNLTEFSARAEATQAAERSKSLAQIQQEIREREQARREQLESEKQDRERAAEQRLSIFRPVRERRDSLLDTQAAFGADRSVDVTMGRRRSADRAMDSQVAELTRAIRALESSGSSGFALRSLEKKLADLSSQRRDQQSGQLSEGLMRDFASAEGNRRVASFQRDEAQADIANLRSRRAGGDENVTDAEIKAAEERAIAASDKLTALARQRLELSRRASEETRRSHEESINSLRQEIELRESSMQRARESLMSARERFGDLSPDEQKAAKDLAAKLKAERESVLRTGQSSTERAEADTKLRQFQQTGAKLTSAKEELTRLERVRDVQESSPERIKQLRARVDELSQDPNRSAEFESAKKDLAAARQAADRAQSSTAGTSRMHELRAFISRNERDPSARGEVQAAREELAAVGKSEKSRRSELSDLRRQRSRTRDKGERERLDQQIRALSPDAVGLDDKITTARQQVAALSQQHETQRQEADTIFQRRGAAQLQSDADRTFTTEYDRRREMGLSTTPADDARREQIEERVRTQVASTMSQDERRTARSIGTEYESDLAEKSAQEQARRAGFDQSFGAGSGTSQEARRFRDASRQRQDLNVKLNLENANWELKPQVDAEELARMSANVVRPMLDQMRAAMEKALAEALAQQSVDQQAKTRGLRSGMVPQ